MMMGAVLYFIYLEYLKPRQGADFLLNCFTQSPRAFSNKKSDPFLERDKI